MAFQNRSRRIGGHRLPPRAWLFIILAIALAGIQEWKNRKGPSPTPAGIEIQAGGAERIAELHSRKKSGEVVEFSARITRELADDREGSRHQRFIVDAGSGPTVMIAHNIDLAPRIPISVGDQVDIRGQYEWNERGGVVHWTHHDPQGRRPGGWIRHRGKDYR